MLKNEESRTDNGIIRIHKNVIASVAAIAAAEIEGVKGVGKNLSAGFLALLQDKSAHSIRVEFDRNGEARIEIPLIIKYGFNIPEVAGKVQENARAALEKMTNVSIKDININVRAIDNS